MSVSPGRWWAVFGLVGVLALAAFLVVESRDDAGGGAEESRGRDRTEPTPLSTATTEVERRRRPKDATSKTFRVTVRDAATGEEIDGSARVLRLSRYGAEEAREFEACDVESWVVVLRSGARFWWKRLEAGHVSDIVATLESPGAPTALLRVPRPDAGAELRSFRPMYSGEREDRDRESDLEQIAEELSWVGVVFSPELEAAAWMLEDGPGTLRVALTAVDRLFEVGIEFARPARAVRRFGEAFDVLESVRPPRTDAGPVVLGADPAAARDEVARFDIELAAHLRARCPDVSGNEARVELRAIPESFRTGFVRRLDRRPVDRRGEVEFWAFPGDYGLVLEEDLGVAAVRLAFLRVEVEGPDLEDLVLVPEPREIRVELLVRDEEGREMAPREDAFPLLALDLHGLWFARPERMFNLHASVPTGKPLRLVGVRPDEVRGGFEIKEILRAYDPDASFTFAGERIEGERLILEYRRGAPPVHFEVVIPTPRSRPGEIVALRVLGVGDGIVHDSNFSLSFDSDGTCRLTGKIDRGPLDFVMVAIVVDENRNTGERLEARLRLGADRRCQVLECGRVPTVRRMFKYVGPKPQRAMFPPCIRPAAWTGTDLERLPIVSLSLKNASPTYALGENEAVVFVDDGRPPELIARPRHVEVRR
ncbi:MAG: hypothetical protein R3F20_15770 [Planctomycetota bacterium]